MANESLKAKLEAYEAACAKSYAKTPERVGLKHNKVYTPLDIEGFDYERDLVILKRIHVLKFYVCTVCFHSDRKSVV